jgi:hypothetical protein
VGVALTRIFTGQLKLAPCDIWILSALNFFCMLNIGTNSNFRPETGMLKEVRW